MSSFPKWLVPMAATLTQERFTGPEWIFERKFDGIRLLAYKNGTNVELFSRNQLPQDIPSVVEAVQNLPVADAILDNRETAKERGFINTPSYAQVAEPLYDRSIGRWERYREQMLPVLPILAPWAQRMGYEI